MRPIRRLVVLVAVALVAAACGARLSDQEIRVAEGAGSAGAAGVATDTAAGDEAADAATETTLADGGAPDASGATADPAGPAGAPGGAAAPASSGARNGGATDVGVTASQIVLGNVTTVSGPVPGLFSGGVAGTKAFVAYVNSHGGIHGRKLTVLNADDRLDPGANRTQTRELAGKVFAFVGSTSGVDNGGAEVLRETGVPDVGLGLLPDRSSLPNHFSPGPVRTDGYMTGPFNYFREKFPGVEKKAAMFWHSQATSRDNADLFKRVHEAAGYVFEYTAETSPTEPNYTSHVLQMRQKGVRYIFTVMETNSISRLAKAMQQQNFEVDVANFGPQTYSKLFLDTSGPAAEGTTVYVPHAMFEDAAQLPEMALFLQWMKRTAPRTTPDIFALYGWASGRLFEQALKAAGPQAKRATLLEQLRAIDQFDANGLLAAAGPASKRSVTCFVVATVRNGAWVRADPPSGYICDKGGFQKVR